MFGEGTGIALRQALLRHYLGASLSKAFEATKSVSRATYYRLRKEYPGEVSRIEGEAKKEALENMSDNLLSLRCAMTTCSVDIQRRAAEILIAGLAVIERIIRGEPEILHLKVLRNGEEVEETRVIIPQPRDQIAAMRLVHAIARDGLLPKGYRETVHQEQPKDDPNRRLPLPRNLPSTFQAPPFVRPESMWPIGFDADQDGQDDDMEQQEPSTDELLH